MASFKETPGQFRECTINEKSLIDQRITSIVSDWSQLEAIIDKFRNHVATAPDPQTNAISTSTTFPIQEVLELIQANPDCEYIRVFNGFDSSGVHRTYLTAITGDFKSILNRPTGVVISACCHCKPCKASVPTS